MRQSAVVTLPFLRDVAFGALCGEGGLADKEHKRGERFDYGGQAVMEGVMMRGEHEWAVSVRAPSGEIVSKRGKLPKALYGGTLRRIPFLRGLTGLWDALGLGMRALMWSTDIALSEEEEEVSFTGPLAWTTVALSIAFAVFLFILLPTLLVGLVDRYVASAWMSNLIEGLIRLAIFIAYVWAIGFMPDIGRVFAYHGAEHKTINAYEANAPLRSEAVADYSRLHMRCGTGFMLVVLVIFVLLSTAIGRPSLLVRFLSRLIMVPVVAGIAYEVIKISARYAERSPLVRWLMAPGLALQRLTTREPDAEMLEVAIHALREVLDSEGLLDASDQELEREASLAAEEA